MDTGDIILWSVILLAFGGYRLYTILYGESKYSMLNVGTWFLCAGVRLLKLISALIVAIFLTIPYWKGKYFAKPVKRGGSSHA